MTTTNTLGNKIQKLSVQEDILMLDNRSIVDIDGNSILRFQQQPLPPGVEDPKVNGVTIQNAASGYSSRIFASGSDTDINLTISAKGTGKVTVGSSLDVSAILTLTNYATNGVLTTINDNGTVAVSNDIVVNDLNIQGGQTVNITTVNSSTYDLASDDYIVHVIYTNAGAVISLTLPTDQTLVGRMIHIKDAGGNATNNNITIDTEGAEKIDGEDTLILNINYESVTLYSNGSNWFTI